MAFHKATMTFVDKGSRKAATSLQIAPTVFDPEDAAVTALLTAIQGISAAAITRVEISTQIGTPAGTVGTGPTQAVEDRVIATFGDTANSNSSFQIPAPKAILFPDDDKKKLVPTVTAFATYITAVQAGAVSAANLALSFKTGGRTTKKKMKV